LHPVFISLDFPAVALLQSKVFSFASNPQPGSTGSCIYAPSDRVAQLYLKEPIYVFVAFYDSQDYGGDILTRLQTGIKVSHHPKNPSSELLLRYINSVEIFRIYFQMLILLIDSCL
jgi:hypothetical protein